MDVSFKVLYIIRRTNSIKGVIMNIENIEKLAEKISKDIVRLNNNNKSSYYLFSMRGMSKEEWASCVAFSDSVNTENHIKKIQEEYLAKGEIQNEVFDLLDIRVEEILTIDSNLIREKLEDDKKELKEMLFNGIGNMKNEDFNRLYDCLFGNGKKGERSFPLTLEEVYAIGLSELKTEESLIGFHNEMKRFAGGHINEEYYYQIANAVLSKEKSAKGFGNNPVAMDFIKENLMEEFVRKNNGALDCGLRILTMGKDLKLGDNSRYEEIPFYRDHLTIKSIGEILGAQYNVRHNKRRFVFPDRVKLKEELEKLIFPELGKSIGKNEEISAALTIIVKHRDMDDYMTVKEINDNITKNINPENKSLMEKMFLKEKVEPAVVGNSYQNKRYKVR